MTPDPPPIRPETLLRQAAFLRSLARGLVLGDLEAEDLVQETWVKALERPPLQPGALRAWLKRVVRGLAWNARRQARRRERREHLAAAPEAAPSPAEILGFQEELLAVAAAVRALPDPLRVAIHLRYYEGLGPPAIAQRLGVPVDTVKYRLKRALERLREILDEGHGGKRRTWLEALAPLAGFGLPSQSAAGTVVLTLGGFSMKKMVAGFGLALLVPIALAFFLPSGNGRPLATGREEAAAPLEGAPSAGEVPVADPVMRTALPPAPPLPPVEGWLVRVTAESGPVAGATVCLLDEVYSRMPEACRRVRNAVLPEDEAILEVGLIRQADAAGVASIPRPSLRPSVLFGWKGDLWGRLDLLSPAGSPLELRLEPDVRLRVQVVDGAGKPVADIPVCLARIQGENLMEVLAGQETREQGLAEFRHLQSLERIPKGEGLELAAMLALPLAGAEGRLLDLAALPAEPVRLVLSPTGSVVVAVEDAAGGLKDGAGSVVLNRWEGGDSLPLQPAHPVPVRGGLARFPFVGLGLTLEARCRRVSVEGRPLGPDVAAIGPGPVAPGQEVRLRVILDAAYPALSGQILDGADRPLSGRTLQASFFRPGDPEGITAFPLFLVRTDAEGRFDLPVAEGQKATGEMFLHLATLALEQEEKLEGQAKLYFPMPMGGADMGVVRLGLPPLLVSGRVVGSREEALPGVTVRVWIAGSRDHWISPGLLQGPATCLSTLTGEDGLFQIRSSLPAAKLHLQAGRPDLGATAMDAAAGATGLTLVLVQGGGVTASLLLPEGAYLGILNIALKPEEEGHPGARHSQQRTQGNRFISFSDLSPGPYTFLVSCPWADEPLVRIPGIEVRSGYTTRDPRLQELDLRHLVQSLEIEVVGEEGPIPMGLVFLKNRRQLGFIAGGKARILAPPGPVDLVLVVPGYRETPVENAWNGRQVVLVRGFAVKLVLKGGQPEVAPGCALYAALVPSGRTPSSLDYKGNPVQDGWTEIRVRSPGGYQVRWMLMRTEHLPGGSRESCTAVPLPGPQEITVRDEPGLQEFKVSFDPALLKHLFK